MTDRIVEEWRQRGLGVLIVGGQVMVADGLREETKDLDACLSSRQCPRMLDWLCEKDQPGRRVEIRPGSAPLHSDWLGRGWTFHVDMGGTDRLDFFGIPLRAPNRLIRRFNELVAQYFPEYRSSSGWSLRPKPNADPSEKK
ncbi:MAG: hypothetical protein HY736_00445 [Verrucomicrobia bacterium]|nr:hypothetical protein [Verrucomicrobiota bacterium]